MPAPGGRELLALLGCGLTAAGMLACPLAEVELYGEVTYWEVAGAERFGALAAVGLAAFAALRRDRPLGWVSALGLWAALLWPFLRPEEQGPSDPIGAMVEGVLDTAGGAVRDIALDFVHLSWGAFVLAAGALLVLGSGFRGRR